MAKKIHWTQTPEGKEKMSKVQKKVWKAKKRVLKSQAPRKANGSIKTKKSRIKNEVTIQTKEEEIVKKATTIAFTHCEAWISVFADTWGISRSNLARRVGKSLCLQADREILGS